MSELRDFVQNLERRLAAETGSSKPEPLEMVLKGRAIELWSDRLGERLWIVADESDARLLGEPRGEVYTLPEMRRVIQIDDPEIVLEIHRWKQRFDGKLRDLEGRSA